MRYFLALLILVASTPALAETFSATFTASAVNLAVLGLYVSTDPLCSNPTKVYDNGNDISSAIVSNLASNPTLGSGQIAEGTYPCIVLKVGTRITLVHNGTGACANFGTGTNGDQGVNFFEQSNNFIDANHPAAGDSLTGTSDIAMPTDSTETVAYLWFSTQSSGASNSNMFKRPTQTNDPYFGLKLQNAFVVSGNQAGTFTVTGVSQIGIVSPANTSCDFVNSNPTWSFQ